MASPLLGIMIVISNFLKKDICFINMLKHHPDKFEYRRVAGNSLLELIALDPEAAIKETVTIDDEDKAHLRLQSLIISENSKGFSGDEIADSLEESKKTGKTGTCYISR